MQKRKNAKNGYNALTYSILWPFSFCNLLQILCKKSEKGVFLAHFSPPF